MRFCCEECRDFPDGEFKSEAGVWFHYPKSGNKHKADLAYDSDDLSPSPLTPLFHHLPSPVLEREEGETRGG